MSYYQNKRTNNYSHGGRPNQSRPAGRRGHKEYINPSLFVRSAKTNKPDRIYARLMSLSTLRLIR